MDAEDTKISNLKLAARSNDPKIFYNALEDLTRNERYRCLYTLDSQGMNLLEWTINNDYWNSAHLLVYYALVGLSIQLRNYADQNPCIVPGACWNQILCHTICLFHNTAQIRDPKVDNEQLPVELQRRLAIYKAAQEKRCFDLQSGFGDDLAVILLIRVGESVTTKNSENLSALARVLMSTKHENYSASFQFIASQHPLIGYTERTDNNTCLLIRCLEHKDAVHFKALRTEEAFEKLVEDHLLTPFIASKWFSQEFTDEERTRVISTLSGEELDLVLTTAVKDDGIFPSLMTALSNVLKSRPSASIFTRTLAIEELSVLNPLVAAYFVQHSIADGASSLRSINQHWKGNLAKQQFSEYQTGFPIDQLPSDMLVLIARYLRADEVMALLLTTKSTSKILTGGSALWQQCFLSNQMIFKPTTVNSDWKSTLQAHSRTHIKWRAGKLVEKRKLKSNGLRVHKQWVVMHEKNNVMAKDWSDESSPILLKSKLTLDGHSFCLVMESAHDTLSTILFQTHRWNQPTMMDIGVLDIEGNSPTHRIALPPELAFTSSVCFMRDKSHIVLGSNLHVFDLQTEQVVNKLTDYRVSTANRNYFDPSTVLACGPQSTNVELRLLDDTLQTMCSIHSTEPVHYFNMVNEHQVLCSNASKLFYFDIRNPAQSVTVLENCRNTSIAYDLDNQRMVLCSRAHASVMTFDLSTMTWDRVCNGPAYYGQTYLYDQYYILGTASDMKIYEMEL